MSVLVTGIDGFVGNYVRRAGDCVGLGNHVGKIDLRDKEKVRAGLAELRPSTVIHLAAPHAFIPDSFQDPELDFSVNFGGTFNLLNGLKAIGFGGRMLFVGSGDMYGMVGENDIPIMESSPLKPRSPYAVSKVAAEALCYQWSQTESFQIVLARPFNHIGPGQSNRFAISDFARQIVSIKLGLTEPIMHVGDIDATRDFTDVRDVVNAYWLLLRHGRSGEPYNVCSGVERTLRSMIEQMCRLAEVEVELRTDPRRLRPVEQRRVCGSNTKLKAYTGWQPQFSIERSLLDIMNYWEEALKA